MHSRALMYSSRAAMHYRADMTSRASMHSRILVHSRALMHCRAYMTRRRINMHSRARMACGKNLASGADMAVSSVCRSRMSSVAHIGTSVAALSIARASKVATLIVVTTTDASRATITIGGESVSRSRATPLISEATMINGAAIACRTAIAVAEATVTSLLAMVLTAMIVVDSHRLIAFMKDDS